MSADVDNKTVRADGSIMILKGQDSQGKSTLFANIFAIFVDISRADCFNLWVGNRNIIFPLIATILAEKIKLI